MVHAFSAAARGQTFFSRQATIGPMSVVDHARVKQEQRYRITSAIFAERPKDFVWTLTFTPLRTPPGAPFDPDAHKEI
jgi:hypothetical protein